MEAHWLKSIRAGGARTKIVALGISSAADVYELNITASAPLDKNVILARNFSSMMNVLEPHILVICGNSHIFEHH